MANERLKTSFGGIAGQYDAARPSYSEPVVELVLARSIAPQSAELLEIGCGTGQATELFAPRVASLLATDISAEVIEIARRRLAAHANVVFQVGSFEALALGDQQFDLVVSAQAFHWVDAEVGVPKAFRVLRPGGALGLIWNFVHYDADPQFRRLRDQIQALVPAFAGWPDSSDARFDGFASSWRPALALAPFHAYDEQRVAWQWKVSARQLRALLGTYSWFQTQAPELQQALLQGFDRLFPDPEGLLEVPMRTLVVLAGKMS